MKKFKKIVSCDLETTGLDPFGDDWITGSFGILDAETLETLDELELESRPNVWRDEAFEIHQIRKETAMNFPSRESALLKLMKFVPDEPFYFLCHSKPRQPNGSFYHFDYAFLKMDFFKTFDIFTFWKFFNDELVFSTQTIAENLRKKSEIPQIKTRLNTLCDHFGIKLNHHNAKSDRKAMEILLKEMRKLERDRTSIVGTRDPKLDFGIFEVSQN